MSFGCSSEGLSYVGVEAKFTAYLLLLLYRAATRPRVLVLLSKQFEMLAEKFKRALFIRELELDPANVPRVFSSPVHEVLDGDLLDSRRLLAGHQREIHVSVSVRADAYVVEHVGETEPSKLFEDPVGVDPKTCQPLFYRRIDGGLDYKFL